jgi:hypothetical protein
MVSVSMCDNINIRINNMVTYAEEVVALFMEE